jgi:hypothetical protein
MQKKFFYLLSGLTVLLLIAAWLYLFLNNNPDMAEDVFSDFGNEGESLPPLVDSTPENNSSNNVNLERSKLRQLTTKQVAGFKEVQVNASSTPGVHYVERGTGHVYSIDLTTGEEVRLSATTFAGADSAHISNDGVFVGISTISNKKTQEVSFGSLSTTTNSIDVLTTEQTLDFLVRDDGLFYFTSAGSQGAVGYAFDPMTSARTNLFSLPFFEASIVWGQDKESDTYVYPKPTYLLEGFLYKINATTLERTQAGGFGFLGLANSSMIVYSNRGDRGPIGYIYNQETQKSQEMQAPVYPDKCTLGAAGFDFYCAHEAVEVPFEYPDTWYKGKIQYKDAIYKLNGETLEGELLVDTFKESGRAIDVIKLDQGAATAALYFINKNDQTLWMYEI